LIEEEDELEKDLLCGCDNKSMENTTHNVGMHN